MKQYIEIDWDEVIMWAIKCKSSRKLKTLTSRYADIKYPDKFYLEIPLSVEDLKEKYSKDNKFREKINSLFV